jgi:hypothetical protein
MEELADYIAYGIVTLRMRATLNLH